MMMSYADGVSNRADWIDVLEVTDAETGEPIDLTDAEILLEIRLWPDGCSPILSASTSNGKITLIELGKAQFHFLRSEMINVQPGSYEIGATVERDGTTDQFIIDTVSIFDGIVRK